MTDSGDSYRVTLNENDKLVDEEEKSTHLKSCHQRCANRTLKVLEKNGSIFIKLGQHLVSCVIIYLKAPTDAIVECYELPSSYRMDHDLYTFARQVPSFVV